MFQNRSFCRHSNETQSFRAAIYKPGAICLLIVLLLAKLSFAQGTVEQQVSGLRELLKNSDEQLRAKAAKALAGIGAKAEVAVHDLVLIIEKDEVPEVRIAAVNAMRSIYFNGELKPGKMVMRCLINALQKDKDTVVRWVACETFGAIGISAKDAAPALLEAMKTTDDAHLRKVACRSLMLIAGPECESIVPVLLVMQRKGIEDAPTEFTILYTLGKIGTQEGIVVPLLMGVLKNKDPKRYLARRGAACGLGEMGGKAAKAVPLLIEALRESAELKIEDPTNIWSDVLFAFRQLGVAAMDAIPVIEQVADNPQVHHKIRREAKSTVKYLMKKIQMR